MQHTPRWPFQFFYRHTDYSDGYYDTDYDDSEDDGEEDYPSASGGGYGSDDSWGGGGRRKPYNRDSVSDDAKCVALSAALPRRPRRSGALWRGARQPEARVLEMGPQYLLRQQLEAAVRQLALQPLKEKHVQAALNGSKALGCRFCGGSRRFEAGGLVGHCKALHLGSCAGVAWPASGGRARW
jgi:hypothetical protein